MLKQNLVKFIKKILNLILNDLLIKISLIIYVSVIERKIKKIYGDISLSYIKNKGNDCKIHGKCTIYDGEKIKLGNGVRIGEGAFIHAKGGVEIGDNTQISRNVVIYSCNHDINGTSIPYDDQYVLKKVTIGSSVWIGMGVMIIPGITIGDGAIIGMGTVVSSNVDEGAIVVGSANRNIKNRDMEEFRNKESEGSFFYKKWPNN